MGLLLGRDRTTAFASLSGPCKGPTWACVCAPVLSRSLCVPRLTHHPLPPASSEFRLEQAVFRVFSPQRTRGDSLGCPAVYLAPFPQSTSGSRKPSRRAPSHSFGGDPTPHSLPTVKAHPQRRAHSSEFAPASRFPPRRDLAPTCIWQALSPTNSCARVLLKSRCAPLAPQRVSRAIWGKRAQGWICTGSPQDVNAWRTGDLLS